MPKRKKTKKPGLEELWINIRPNKISGARIHVQTDTADHSISERNPVDWSQFTDDQKFELKWLLDNVYFNQENFDIDPAEQKFVRLLWAPSHYKELRQIAFEAGEKGIEFSPMKIMLEALATETEKMKARLRKKK